MKLDYTQANNLDTISIETLITLYSAVESESPLWVELFDMVGIKSGWCDWTLNSLNSKQIVRYQGGLFDMSWSSFFRGVVIHLQGQVPWCRSLVGFLTTFYFLHSNSYLQPIPFLYARDTVCHSFRIPITARGSFIYAGDWWVSTFPDRPYTFIT